MNNYSNKTYRQKINDNGTQNSYSTVLSNETVNRKISLENSNDYYYDQQTDIQFIARSNQQNRIPAPSSINLLPLDSSSLTPYRRIRALLEENNDFIPVDNRTQLRRVASRIKFSVTVSKWLYVISNPTRRGKRAFASTKNCST
ncbi:unnamed protein product [Rotaria sordida]|uniref:Uncharacterized protein n=1 Tax=Rotaria sordida TaxID=392033 RepID=A0A819NSF1_9BILA|nr:unnamed protein product [Rotaria sordida]CAF4001105.1 unnamed protein product [Rotaria sordida]